MCLSRKEEINKNQLDGYKVLIEQDDGYHAIKHELDEGALEQGKQHTAIGNGFSVFFNKDNAERFKEFLIDLLENSKRCGKMNRDGQPVIKKIEGKDVFLQGRQAISEDEIWEDNRDKQINAFRCNQITIKEV